MMAELINFEFTREQNKQEGVVSSAKTVTVVLGVSQPRN